MVTKLCKDCGNTYPLVEFTKATPKIKWDASGNFNQPTTPQYHTYCKPCNARRAKEFRARHKETTGSSDYRGSGRIKKVPREDRMLMSLIRARAKDAKSRAAKYSQPAPDIDEDFLYALMNTQERKCAATGISFVIDKKHPLCPSLDKIEPEKGYVRGNVQWLSWAANRAKGDLSNMDFIEMCKRVVEVAERATTIP